MSTSKSFTSSVDTKLQNYKQGLLDLAANLQDQIQNAVSLESVGYRQVAVLSITWSNDTMGVNITEDELLAVFMNVYKFVTETCIIDTTQTKNEAARSFQKKLFEFSEKYDNEDSLLIFVYSGHGAIGKSGLNYSYLIAGRANRNGLVGPTLKWTELSSILANRDGDLLLIFDSCYAGQLAAEDGPELLAAANWNSVAEAGLDTSFSRILARELKELKGTPIHIPHPNKKSIVLEKLQGVDGIRQRESLRRLQIGTLEGNETRVLISVRLKHSEGLPNLEGWKNWLAQNIPPSVHPSQITVEGQFGIGSSLILMSLPLAIWTMIPKTDSAYGFVAFVNTGVGIPVAYSITWFAE